MDPAAPLTHLLATVIGLTRGVLGSGRSILALLVLVYVAGIAPPLAVPRRRRTWPRPSP